MINKKYFMTTKNKTTGIEKEEEMNAVMVTEKSPHFPSYEAGLNDIPEDVTEEQLKHYAENLVAWFNFAASPRQDQLEFVCCRIENP